MKKRTLWAVLIVGVWLSIELIAFIGLVLLDKNKSIKYDPFPNTILNSSQRQLLNKMITGKTDYVIHHPLLGWAIKANGVSPLYQANSQGLRGNREYTESPSPQMFRINTYGDSFTHGDEVSNNQTWQSYMEVLYPELEVLNFGVGGYGLDQSYLRYKSEGYKYKSQIVFIGYMFTDIERTVNTFRPFFLKDSGIPLTKPRFKIKDNQLVLVPNPLSKVNDYQRLLDNDPKTIRKIAKHDFYYHKKYFKGKYDFLPSIRLWKIGKREYKILTNEKAKTTAYRIEELLFQQFYNLVAENGSRPIIIFFPNKYDIYAAKQKKEKRYIELLDIFKRNQWEYVDLMDAFNFDAIDDIEGLFQENKHYSPRANRIVAEYLLNILKEKNLLN